MKRLVAVAALCAVGWSGVACSKDDKSTPVISKSQNAENVARTKALPGTDIIAAPRSRLKDGGTVHIAIEDFPKNFNQFTNDGNDVATALVSDPTAPLFFDFSEKGEPVLDHDYLISAAVTRQQPFTVEYKLNPKAVWSDGTPMGYADFLGMWKAMSGADHAYDMATTNGFEKITSVRKGTDEHDVLVTFSQRYAAWPSLFNGLLPHSLTATPQAFNSSWRDKPLVSGGPFVISKVDSTAQAITLTRNPRWWGQPPKLEQIVMRALSLDAISGAFKNGEVDIVDASKDPSVLKAAEGVHGTRILRSSSPGWHLLNLNARSSVLRDPKMRRAISYGIPRDQIATLRQQPFGAPATVLGNHILGVTQTGYRDNATAAIGPDPKKAAAMLDQLGWKLDGKYRKKNGATLTLKQYIPSDTPSQTDVSQVVQRALATIGVKVDIISLPISQFADHVNDGNYDIVYMGWTGSPFPECDMKSIFYPAISNANKTGASSPKVGSLFDQACATLDENERTALANQLDAELFRIDTMLPLFNDPSIAASKPDLANIKNFSSAFEHTHWQDVGWVKPE
ncbi:MAG TPA: ABC transporter family substrate-binding protein [Mycobacteriales bacterium]|nr:ABC transporter family substrate-binding protein [Mycobacteriales bacterium]